MLQKEDLKNLIIKATEKAIKGKKLPVLNLPKDEKEKFWQSVSIEHPENKEFGDWASNVAMKLAGPMKISPMEIAEVIVEEINNLSLRAKRSNLAGGAKRAYSTEVASATKAGRPAQITGLPRHSLSFVPRNDIKLVKVEKPGFINLYLSDKYLQKSVGEILKKKDKFGDLKIGKNKKIQIEFISANPTGPLTLGNGRGGFMGDVLRNVMKSAGYKVEAEYFVNDAKNGNQVRELGKTLLGEGEMYKSAYLDEVTKGMKKVKSVENMGYKVAQLILKEQKKVIKNKFKIKFDNYFSEEGLYKNKSIEGIVKKLKKSGHTYEKDGAVWLKTTQGGDNEDRVLIRSDGKPTYFVSDVAYHLDKFKRGYKKIINFWGADHHGHIKRLKIALEMLGYDSSKLDVVTMQLVRLVKDGKEVKMSKRAGQYVTLEELIEEVGLDVARFFFLMVSANRHMDFDLGLAKEKSEKNPVYYVQYAGARIHSILAKSKILNPKSKTNSKFKVQNSKTLLLSHMAELDLIKKLIELPEIIEDTANDYQVHRLPNYAVEVARTFHNFYGNCQVISEDKKLTQARLGLILVTQIVLKKVLDLMGVSMPDKM